MSETNDRTYVIVVGIDFDDTSEHALREAFTLARVHGATQIHAVHALGAGPPGKGRAVALGHTNELLEEIPRKVRAFILAKSADIEGASGHAVFAHCRLGNAVDVLEQLAVDVNADVLVVGTHGRRGLKRLALGSVAAKLVETAHCPVLIARPKDFTGQRATAKVEPVCPDCAKVRADTGGATQWCEYHSRNQGRPHTYGYSETFPIGGHDPGIVATGGD